LSFLGGENRQLMGCHMPDNIEFKDLGKIAIPDKGDIKTERIVADVEKKIAKEQIEGAVREDTGTAPEKKGQLTKDVPQMAFRVIASVIECKKFELDDTEAQTVAANLNILLPLDGKIVAVFVILLIVLNKVYVCMDAIKAKATKPGNLEPEQPKRADLPPQIS